MMKLLTKILLAPIFHFFIIGCLLFFLNTLLPATNKPEYTIAIDQARIEWIKSISKKENGYFPDENELSRLIDNDIQQEVFFREALSIGLEKDDVIIRRRLIEKFIFMLEGVTNNSLLTDEELQVFYNQNTHLFMQDARYSFSHYYFSEDSRDNAKKDALHAQMILIKNSNLLADNQKIGDPFMMRYHYENISSEQLSTNFGKQFAENLARKNIEIRNSLAKHSIDNRKVAQSNNDWFGPIKSIYGWHLIKMKNFHKSYLPEYQKIEPKVLTAFLNQQRIIANDVMYKKLLSKYRINIDGIKYIK